jgi:hypothetical protein
MQLVQQTRQEQGVPRKLGQVVLKKRPVQQMRLGLVALKMQLGQQTRLGLVALKMQPVQQTRQEQVLRKRPGQYWVPN